MGRHYGPLRLVQPLQALLAARQQLLLLLQAWPAAGSPAG
jgi:hypothetical protein